MSNRRQLGLISLGFAIGYVLTDVLNDMSLGITPGWFTIVALIVLVAMLAAMLEIHRDGRS